jgi:hypothetical protein
VQVEGNWRRVCWSEGHLPRFGSRCVPVGGCAREGAVSGLGFADIGLVVEEGWILTVVDLSAESEMERKVASN